MRNSSEDVAGEITSSLSSASKQEYDVRMRPCPARACESRSSYAETHVRMRDDGGEIDDGSQLRCFEALSDWSIGHQNFTRTLHSQIAKH